MEVKAAFGGELEHATFLREIPSSGELPSAIEETVLFESAAP
jgi:hypothetical protein